MITGKTKKLKKRSTSPQHTVVLPTFPYAVLPHHHTGVTKLEQHERLVKYDRKVINFVPDKLHAFERHCQVSSESMPTLNQLCYKFQQYRMLFDQVIKSSGLYGEALQEIKAMYDGYTADHIESMTEESQQPTCLYQSSDIEKLRNRVNRLENDVTTLVAENAKLQDVLKKETDVYSSAKVLLEAPVVVPPDDPTEPVEFSDKVEGLQLQIVEQRQSTQSYLDQRVGKVPLSVVRNLEHALKETEISIQKLDKHNSYLKTRIEELTKHLEILLSNAPKAKTSASKRRPSRWSVVSSKLQPVYD